MKLCPYHDDSLRAALTVRGLDSYMADSPAEAERRAQRSILSDDEVDIDCFEPYAMAVMALVGNAIELVGSVALEDNPNGTQRCVLCFVQYVHEGACPVPGGCGADFTGWCAYAADEMLAIAQGFSA